MSYSLNSKVVFDPSNLSAFGTLEQGPLTPLIQIDFIQGINIQTGTTSVLNGATIDTNAGRLRVQSGTNSAGEGTYRTIVAAKYRAGQGITARFTGVFSTGIAGCKQYVGMAEAVDFACGYMVGYNGTSFGVCIRNGSTDTWIPQSSWNGDKCDGTGLSGFTINPQFGNVFMIKYPFLGYGNITFFVEDQDSSRFILMHTIKYTNSSTEIQVSNPNLDFMAKVVNSGNTTNKTLYVGSIGVFSSGERLFISNPKWATDNVKTGVTAETNLFTLRNATTFNGVRNKGLIRPNTISIGSASAGGTPTSCVLRFRLDGTVGGVPAFTPINGSTADNGVTITNGNSFTSADTAGTTSTGGLVIFNVALISQSTQIIDLSNYNIFIPPGSRLTLGCFASGNTAFSVGITWTEDF